MPDVFHTTPIAKRPMLNRRRFFAATGALGGAAFLSACSGGDGASTGDAWTFTDDRGETVELDGPPETIVMFSGLAAALYDYGVDVRIVFGPTVTPDGGPDLLAGRLPVDELQILGNAFGEFDIEAFAAANPQLTASQHFEGFPLWYVPEDRVEEVEALTPTVGIEVTNGTLDEVIARHERFAEALGADLDSAANTEAAERYRAAVEAVRAAAAANPLTILVCNAFGENLNIANPASFTVIAACADLGATFVVPEAPDVSGYWEALSWENAAKYDADLVFLDARTGNLQAEDLADHPTWNTISGVAAGQIFPWNSEPAYSTTGAAEILEAIAEAITNARPVM